MANQTQIKKALQQPYDLSLFAKNVLSPIFGNSFIMKSSPSKATVEPNQTESKSISEVFIYGSIRLEEGTEITCYEIILQEKVKIEQSKIAIQRYARKLLISGQAALVNFVNPDNKNLWRLTYIAKDSTYSEKGISDKLTNAKRYTYLLGTFESCKTTAERFEILSSETSLSLETITKAFSVEKLSKAFFDEYLIHYNRFVEYLTSTGFRTSVFANDDKAIRDFAKKLLGRIVFLYFVQKKGWLGASNLEYKDGLQNFIMKFYEQAGANDSFYNNYLKILFFDTLNKERTNDDFKMPDGTILKIPFLNGGLFDKEKFDNEIISFKPELFHNVWDEDNPKTRGFLDFLNAYNFTIYEDSPDEQIVAVDPEMLGHIFENLLEDNKDKGAYYTPKEIVHYMCQESLIEYLATNLKSEYTLYKELGNNQIELFGNETKKGQLSLLEDLGDKALNNSDIEQIVKQKDISKLTDKQLVRMNELLDIVKICDPAIGSGAFPMGLLQEITAIKEIIAYETGKEWKPAEVKENIIQNSIYGVDIEKGAVDIARLRFWLSLVVDEEKPKALPNLDYKILIGNSLVSKFENEVIEIDWKLTNNPALKQSRPDLFKQINQNVKNIYTSQHEFFHSVSDKNKLKLKIRNLKIELLQTIIEIQKQILKEKGINPDYATKNKEIVEITERKIKHEGLNKILSKLEKIKNNPEKPLNYFDWQLNFPEVLNPSLTQANSTGKSSNDIENANNQIQILNIQINAINQYLKRQNINEHILNLQTNIVNSQISLIKEQLEQIEKKITEIYGKLFKVEGNIVKEPSLSFVYSIRPINQSIKEINKKVDIINPKLSKTNGIENNAGFDIVIGNPPYIKEYTNKNAFDGFRDSKYYQGKMDIWYGFTCHGLDMTKQDTGILSFIATNNWTTNSGASLMRKRVAENAQIVNIIDFNNYKIFENAGIQTMIMIFRNKKASEYIFDYRKITHKTPEYIHVLDILNKVRTKDNLLFAYPVNVANIESNTLSFNTPEIENILDKIKNETSINLNEKTEIAQGIVLPQDYIIKKTLEVLGSDFNIGDGIFALSNKEKENLNLNEKEKELIKPYFSTINFSRYYANPQNTEWLIYTGSEFKNPANIQPYPNIKQHLDKFEKVITSDNKPYGLHRARVEDFFKGEKIIVQRKCPGKPIFTYTDFDTYVSATFYVIKTKRINQKYLTALLNSKLIEFWLKHRGKMQGNNYQLDKEPLLEIPIKQIEKTISYETLIDKILTLKKENKDTTALEHEIDQMVYKLYELTEDEIKIVEGEC